MLDKNKVRDLWDETALIVLFPDGVSALCQDSGYSIYEIYNYMDQGCEVMTEEYFLEKVCR